MANIYLKYLTLNEKYNSLCVMIGRLISEEEIIFDFENNCIRFCEEHNARVYAKYFDKAKLLRSEMDELGGYFDSFDEYED